MNFPGPSFNHRDDIEPFSAAALIENTYDAIYRPSRRMRAEIAPTNDPRANDPGSVPHASADDVVPDNLSRPVEDLEGILSRKSRAKTISKPTHRSKKKPRLAKTARKKSLH